MNTMKWLLRREFWENKGMFFWAPIIVGAVMIVFMGLSSGHLTINFHDDSGQSPGTAQQSEAVMMLANGYMASSTPLFLMMGVVIFFYCLGALYDDRRDRSILFWKSLPISDTQTVLSKVAAALIMAPLITLAAATVTSLALAVILGISLTLKGIPVFGTLLTDPAFYAAPFQVLGLLPVYFLWALPTIGWLLLVSSWARSKVFLWAVGVPVLAIVIIKWFEYQFGSGLDVNWVIRNVIGRALGGLIPGSWVFFDRVDPQQLIGQGEHTQSFALTAVFARSWATLAGPSVWIGAAAGVAMIYGAIRLRALRDEG